MSGSRTSDDNESIAQWLTTTERVPARKKPLASPDSPGAPGRPEIDPVLQAESTTSSASIDSPPISLAVSRPSSVGLATAGGDITSAGSTRPSKSPATMACVAKTTTEQLRGGPPAPGPFGVQPHARRLCGLRGRHRWVVDRTFAWFAQFRRLATRYERRADIHFALTKIAAAIIAMNQIRRFR